MGKKSYIIPLNLESEARKFKDSQERLEGAREMAKVAITHETGVVALFQEGPRAPLPRTASVCRKFTPVQGVLMARYVVGYGVCSPRKGYGRHCWRMRRSGVQTCITHGGVGESSPTLPAACEGSKAVAPMAPQAPQAPLLARQPPMGVVEGLKQAPKPWEARGLPEDAARKLQSKHDKAAAKAAKPKAFPGMFKPGVAATKEGAVYRGPTGSAGWAFKPSADDAPPSAPKSRRTVWERVTK